MSKDEGVESRASCSSRCGLTEEALRQIASAVCSIRYGAVHILIHDSQIVQIEKAEKIRLDTRTHLTPGGIATERHKPTRPLEGSDSERSGRWLVSGQDGGGV